MDFDDEDKPKEVSKTRKFAPSRGGKPKPKPKPEPTAEKTEPPPSQAPPLHSESLSKSEHDIDAKFPGPKVESQVCHGFVKMEIDSKLDKEPELEPETAMEAEPIEVQDQIPMEEDKEEDEVEEDVVVREIDVFFNPSIDTNSKLYVLQYPLRPSWRPYEMDERCEEVRVNPSTSQVEIDLSIDVYSKNYNADFGRELNMTKQTLTTTWRQPPTLDYAVGVLSGDKLHLNPVHAVAQLRPSMEYLSSNGKKKQPEESVGTSKKQNKGALADQKPIPEEKWVALKYHGLQSEFCSKYLTGMMANGNSSIDFNMSPDVYINKLCRGESYKNSESKDPLKRVSTSLPLKERVKKLVSEIGSCYDPDPAPKLVSDVGSCYDPKSKFSGPPLVRYSVLKHYAGPDDSDQEFLEVLQQSAVLVQGLWTPKTSLLKLDGADGLARDYVLSLFNNDSVIKYSQVESTGRQREKVKNMLKYIAKERPLLSDWKFIEPTDVSFINSYPEIVEKQNNMLKALEEKVKLVIEGGKSKANSVRNNVSKTLSVAVKPEIPTSVSDKGGSSRNTIARVVREKMPDDIRMMLLPKALKKVFQAHKVCSYETICQGLRELAVSISNNPKADSSMAQRVASVVDAHQEELKDIVNEVTVNIHGSYVSISSPDHPEYDPLREVVIKLLQGNMPGAKVMKADVFAAGRSELKRDITNNEYTKVMHDLCESNSSGWVLRKAR